MYEINLSSYNILVAEDNAENSKYIDAALKSRRTDVGNEKIAGLQGFNSMKRKKISMIQYLTQRRKEEKIIKKLESD